MIFRFNVNLKKNVRRKIKRDRVKRLKVKTPAFVNKTTELEWLKPAAFFRILEWKLEQSTVWVDAVSKSHEIFLNEFQSSVSYDLGLH